MTSKHQYANIRIPIEPDNIAIMRHEDLCIRCGQCRQVCTNEVSVGGHYDLEKTNDTAVCVHCGQCANHCPVNCITERYHYQEVRDAITARDKVVIFETSPSVRVAIGEMFGYKPGTYMENKMVAAIRLLGADYIFDTTFGADLTITEEASELVDRIVNGSGPLPMFTSCCPAWVKFAEMYYPEILPHISTSKSPISMQGPTIKTYFAEKMQIDPEKILSISVAPCTAKKFEMNRPEKNSAGLYTGDVSMRDIDYVITTRELGQWIEEAGIDFSTLPGDDYDDLMGRGSGAGIIFGNTGGVMEAALRSAYYYVTGETPPKELLKFKPVRGLDGIKEAEVTIGGVELNIAVVQSLANVRTLISDWKSGRAKYDYVEVMNCIGGCIGGGGQPKTEIPPSAHLRKKRIEGLYDKDHVIPLRFSHENPDVIKAYDDFYEKPLSHKAEQLLHTTYESKQHLLGQS